MKAAEKEKLKRAILLPDSFLNPVNNIVYSPETLLSNWHERRQGEHGKALSKGVVPLLTSDDGKCSAGTTVYNELFQAPAKKVEDIAEDFLECKLSAFRNRLEHETTTMTDLHANTYTHYLPTTRAAFDEKLRIYDEYILRERIEKKRRKERHILDEKTIKSYAANINFGLIDYKFCDEHYPIDITTYREHYRKPTKPTKTMASDKLKPKEVVDGYQRIFG